MNKRTLFHILSIAIFALSGCASFEEIDPSLLGPKEWIVEVPDTPQDELFIRARLWVAETYNSAEDVITFDDQESGTIKGTGGEWLSYLGHEYFFIYNFSTYVRDNKAKIEFSNPTYRDRPLTMKVYYDQLMDIFEALAEDFKNSISEEVF